MSSRTLQQMQFASRREDYAMQAATEADLTKREQKTPANELPRAVDALFNRIVAAMSDNQEVRPPGRNDRKLGFRIDLGKLGAFGTTNDVMAGVMAKFGEIGFECRHSFNVGVNTYDWLDLTCPQDWLQRLLTPICKK